MTVWQWGYRNGVRFMDECAAERMRRDVHSLVLRAEFTAATTKDKDWQHLAGELRLVRSRLEQMARMAAET